MSDKYQLIRNALRRDDISSNKDDIRALLAHLDARIAELEDIVNACANKPAEITIKIEGPTGSGKGFLEMEIVSMLNSHGIDFNINEKDEIKVICESMNPLPDEMEGKS